MGIYKKGNVYWMIKQYRGKRIERSLNTSVKRVAEERYSKLVAEIIDGSYFEKQREKTVTFREMTTRYMQKYHGTRDEHTVKKLLPVFGSFTLADITTDMISDYRDERIRTVKPATVYQELSLMRRMWNVARKEWKWTKANPVGNKNARDRWLTINEEKTLLDKATNPVWLKPLLTMALHTGMRRGEILTLLWKDVDFFRRLLTVQRSKNGEKRSIPMSHTLLITLKEMKVRDISGKVFPLAVRSLREAFDKTLEKADIKDFHFHDLRHTFATRLVQSGIDLYRVKELLGHKTISMTTRYAHHYPESLRSSIEVLDKNYYNSTTVEAQSV
jgi:integrase